MTMKPNLFVIFSCVLCAAFMAGCSAHHYAVDGGFVSFYLKDRDAKTVEFHCSADDFRSHQAREVRKGTWEIRVKADRSFSYFYLVDGKVVIPPCPMKEKDDFGQENCLFCDDM